MIKVYKSDKAPEKLAEAGYTCDEVKQAILNAQKEFSQMREKFLIDLQLKFLKSLGFCFVEN